MDSWAQDKGTIRYLGRQRYWIQLPGRHFDDLHGDVFKTTAPAFPNRKDYITWACECYMDLQEQLWLTMI